MGRRELCHRNNLADFLERGYGLPLEPCIHYHTQIVQVDVQFTRPVLEKDIEILDKNFLAFQ